MSIPIKSPLRYPGGKSKAIDQIVKFLPTCFREFREPFIGGGSVYIHLRQQFPTYPCWINDLNKELYLFWKTVQDDLEALTNEVERIRCGTETGREIFTRLSQVDAETLTDFERAVRFFVLNRITFSGTVEAGGYSQKAYEGRFTRTAVERLACLGTILPGTLVTNLDYREILNVPGDDVFLFLDPPYYSATKSKLYGRKGILHTSFDHAAFAAAMRECPHKWLITYDDCAEIRANFEFAWQYEWTLQYGMNNFRQGSAAKGKELFLTNYEVPQVEQLSLMLEARAPYTPR